MLGVSIPANIRIEGTMHQHEILTVEEVAGLMKVSERTIYDWAQKGKIPCGKLGSTWRFKRSEIEKWIDGQITNNNSERAPSDKNSLVFTPDLVVFMDCSTKMEAIDKLAACLADKLDDINHYELAAAILKRESLMSTGIGMGIGVPHVRLPKIRTMKMAVGISSKGLTDYESIDDEPVRLVFLIAAGQDQHVQYLKLLAKVSSHLKNEDYRKKLLKASDKNEVYKIISEIIDRSNNVEAV